MPRDVKDDDEVKVEGGRIYMPVGSVLFAGDYEEVEEARQFAEKFAHNNGLFKNSLAIKRKGDTIWVQTTVPLDF